MSLPPPSKQPSTTTIKARPTVKASKSASNVHWPQTTEIPTQDWPQDASQDTVQSTPTDQPQNNQISRAARQALTKADNQCDRTIRNLLQLCEDIDIQVTRLQAENDELTRALAKDIMLTIRRYCDKLFPSHMPTLSKAPPTPAIPPTTWADIVNQKPYNYQHTPPTSQSPKARTRPTPPNRDGRIFIRLSENHEAREEHTFTTLQNLRKALPKPACIKEVQKVVSGLALIPSDSAAGAEILLHHMKITEALSGGVVEKEER
ncbi:MAG: hypothetical protein M1840_009182 [Geoglossum simile]|nr:MAG: hypothetical protein M1840_009182 [Geoglossum simile]